MSLENLLFSFTGSFSMPENELTKLVKNNGGQVFRILSRKTDFLVTSQSEVDSKAVKVTSAKNYNVPIVSEKFIHDCIAAGKRLDHTKYLLNEQTQPDFFVFPSSDTTHTEEYEESIVTKKDKRASSPKKGRKEPISEPVVTFAKPAPKPFTPSPKYSTTTSSHSSFEPSSVSSSSFASSSSSLVSASSSFASHTQSLSAPAGGWEDALRQALPEEHWGLREEEDHYRQLFAQDRNHSSLNNPHVLLIDAFKNSQLFRFEREDDKEKAIPKVLTQFNRAEGKSGQASIVSKSEFLQIGTNSHKACWMGWIGRTFLWQVALSWPPWIQASSSTGLEILPSRDLTLTSSSTD
eukprot:TRINITY_DN853_c0_g2_i3.p1 TRINITY_DN853_c0_g2~~TRINITY_DN853_c0_g2_i3.p1  ORF type:complete len:384 (-),score=105.41 TRINITY_DN853_c0_g2_i3:1123-2172(-)